MTTADEKPVGDLCEPTEDYDALAMTLAYTASEVRRFKGSGVAVGWPPLASPEGMEAAKRELLRRIAARGEE